MELQINPKFKEVIPPLDFTEYENLRISLKSEGCRDAIITWNGVIVDGHNRYELCTELDIPFRTFEKDFDSEDDVIEWIMCNQLSRRNLSDVERGRIALKLKGLIAERAKVNCSIGGELKGSTNLSNLSTVDTRREVAKMAGISEGTISKIEKVDHEAPASIREAMGKTISIDKAAQFNTALKTVPKEERDEEAVRLLRAGFKAREEQICREEKMVKILHNIISAAAIDYEYICEECVDVYIKRIPSDAAGIAKAIDEEIEWLEKLKDLVLRRAEVTENG